MAVQPPITAASADPIETLREVMRNEEKFVKVHAAEGLMELGATEGIKNVFLAEEQRSREVPMFRVGIFRVLARVSAGTPDEQRWIDEIRRVAMDVSAPDRIGAIESLAKLDYALPAEDRKVVETAAASDNSGLALFSLWALMPGTSENPQDRVAAYLSSQDAIARLRAAAILRKLPNLSPANRAALKAMASAEPQGTSTHVYANSAAYTVARQYSDDAEAARARAALLQILESGEPTAKQEACRALADAGEPSDIEFLRPLLRDHSPPIRVGAAIAVAKLTAGR